MIDFGMCHAADDGDLVSYLGCLVHVRTKVDARQRSLDWIEDTSILCGRVGLWVKAIHMGESTLQIDVDHRLGFGLVLLRLAVNSRLRFELQ